MPVPAGVRPLPRRSNITASPKLPTVKYISLPLAITLAALLAACATPFPGGSAPGEGGESSLRRIRPATPMPDWTALHGRLSASLGGESGVEIGTPDADGLKLQIPVADGFASGETQIQAPLARALDAIAPALAGEAGVAVQVVGHTDSQGSEMRNLQLSIARAEAVAEHLRSRGIALERLSADGRGEADPLTSNATEAGRARNRRVELLLGAMP